LVKTKSGKTKKLAQNIDGGAPTQANYQFQYYCGAIIAINMYSEIFESIQCEHTNMSNEASHFVERL